MEFLRPEGKSASPEFHFTRVRLAWYYRPSDVTDRPVTDSRLLLAAIYSEVCDINQIRGKCHVVHRDKISDLSGWKKRPDRFYFNRLFDPYIKKEFEVIPSTDVRNVPDEVRNTLISRYEYVVSEKEFIPDLTDGIRLPDSVQCDSCKKYFHMRCVQPPLLAKPSRGYGWTCAPCSKRHEEAVDSRSELRHNTPGSRPGNKSNAPAVRGRGRPRKDKTLAEKEENMTVKHFKMWPFRYFGQYTVAEDTLDPEDLIFCRAATRVGPKYQPTYPDFGSAHVGPDEERGEDKTIEVLSALHDFTSAEFDEVAKCLATIANERVGKSRPDPSGVDFLTEAVRQLTDASINGRPLTSVTMKTIEAPRMERWKTHPTKHYTDHDWTENEKETFEESINAYGAELRSVRDDLVVKSMPEVVRYYGHWKSSKLGEQNRKLREEGPPPSPTYARYAPSTTTYAQTVGPSEDDTDSSVVLAVPPSKPPSCGACRTKESKKWWKAPKGLQSTLLCDNCGLNWRKYADLNVRPVREESLPARTGEKREREREKSPAVKKAKVSEFFTAKSSSAHSTPPPQPNVPQIRCSACMKNGPVGKVLKCSKCGFQCHAASCGATVDPSEVDLWECDLCRNDEAQEASVYHDCLLCPRERAVDGRVIGPSPDSYLRACKPTEAQGWAHVLCSVFMPNLEFTDSGHLKAVEGLSTLSAHRWTSRCSICREKDGATVKCPHCSKEFHVSCAWTAGYKFGFEIQPVKSSRRETTTTATFQGESGLMAAVVICKDHDSNKRRIYDICETDEGGESALQVYCRAYKQAPIAETYGLLRKARRLDQILNLQLDTPLPDPTLDNLSCSQCATQYTPAFYPTDTGAWLCHACNFQSLPAPIDMQADRPVTPLTPTPMEDVLPTPAPMEDVLPTPPPNGISTAPMVVSS
ncbi:putative PHD type zinc finger protein with BAH domain-containing protein [Marasmius crinis-equi]|uniref:PHD type zinc finger protein with BAH domain-containing protein n=1 Tax=Marasmius crinis-equi TaxID=585013 RepID=A0ABR3FGP5_9AGAR